MQPLQIKLKGRISAGATDDKVPFVRQRRQRAIIGDVNGNLSISRKYKDAHVSM